MAWAVWGAAFVLIAGAVAICVFTYTPRFWRVVARNPDLALSVMVNEGCLVDRRPPTAQQSLYLGPFNVRSSRGKAHMVFVPAARKALVERRVEAMLATTRPGLALRGGHSVAP